MEEHSEEKEMHPQQVIEKRLSKGVIRRRVKPEDVAAAAAAAPSPQVKIEAKAESSDVAKDPVVPKAPVVEVPKKPEPAAVSEAPQPEIKKSGLRVVGQMEIPAKKVAVVPPPVAVDPAADSQHGLEKKSIATKVGEEIIKDVGAKKAKVEERENRPLTFQERLRGTISLDRIRPTGRPAAAGAKKAETGASPTGVVGDKAATGRDIEESDDDKKSLVKKLPVKGAKKPSSVKMIGGDLDIDGHGKSTTLTHLVRTTALDRVFRPTDATSRKRVISKKRIKQTQVIEKKASKRFIEMHAEISVRDFAQQLGVKAGEVLKKLMELGVTANINSPMDKDTAVLVAQDYQYEIRDVSFNEQSILGDKSADKEVSANLQVRPPVVTIMGHVDHGKTSLLDAIRSTNITEGEAGGITQHIGAYTVTLPQGNITFLDTPGHEAFTAMRARGAKVTDFVILVVAADDGVMPQTEESIAHAKAAEVPIIVAVNKCDKPDANPERVMRQLSEKGLLSEEWGGDTLFVKVSAKTKAGVPELLESVLLQAEVLELKADPQIRASGIVLEAKLDKFKGPLATLLVQEGTLKVGDIVVVGSTLGRVRALSDWKGQTVKEAPPSTAVEVLGLEGVPEASDAFNVVNSDQDARSLVEHRQTEKKKLEASQSQKLKLEDMFSKMKQGEFKELNVILKTDVQGSLEAVRDAVLKLGNEEVKTKVIHAAAGGIRDTDVNLAQTSKAIIIGFNVRPETSAIHLAKDKGVDIKLYKIIYELVNEVKLAMQGLLAPTIKETYLGRAEVRNVFTVSKVGTVAGCMVVDGQIQRQANIRLLRDSVVIHEGKIGSLKRFKDDAREVKQGFECGISIDGYQDVKPGDVLEAFITESIVRTLD